ncbi:hypothetical protein E3P99_01950 [Wallemia hederae]|uniref:Uncharacterized protein n=1 Tax=Wallemia hederae TaxID=1540922 RepID=A0A4T0FNB6_9BASI|nr:hypothetical protein E3P99_01950 [Wallemia hederae]
MQTQNDAPETAQTAQTQQPSYVDSPSYPGKVVVHGRAADAARQAARYKRAYLIVRERWNEAQHETVEIKNKIKEAQSALQDVEDENDVLLEALIKYEPGLEEAAATGESSAQLKQEQPYEQPQQPEYHEQQPHDAVKQESIYSEQPSQSTTPSQAYLHPPQIESIHVQPTLSTSKRSIDDIMNADDSSDDVAKRQRL